MVFCLDSHVILEPDYCRLKEYISDIQTVPIFQAVLYETFPRRDSFSDVGRAMWASGKLQTDRTLHRTKYR